MVITAAVLALCLECSRLGLPLPAPHTVSVAPAAPGGALLTQGCRRGGAGCAQGRSGERRSQASPLSFRAFLAQQFSHSHKNAFKANGR